MYKNSSSCCKKTGFYFFLLLFVCEALFSPSFIRKVGNNYQVVHLHYIEEDKYWEKNAKANWTQVQENRTLTQKFHTRNYMASYYKYAKIYLEIHAYIKCKTLNIFKPNWDISSHGELLFIKCSICKMCSKTKIHQNKPLSVNTLKGVRFIWPLWLLFKFLFIQNIIW